MFNWWNAHKQDEYFNIASDFPLKKQNNENSIASVSQSGPEQILFIRFPG